jgi:hypothetical protein
MIPEARLDKYLQQGFEAFLPDDLSNGEASVDQLAFDFVTYRKCVEQFTTRAQRSADCDSHASSDHRSDESDMQSEHWSSTESGESLIIPLRDGPGSLRWRRTDDGDSFGLWSRSNSRDWDEDEDDASIHCDIDDDFSFLTEESIGEGDRIIEEP